jgi:hypothetical protein
MPETTRPDRLVRPRASLPSLRRVADEGIRAGARILIVSGVGAIAALPFLATAAFTG